MNPFLLNKLDGSIHWEGYHCVFWIISCVILKIKIFPRLFIYQIDWFGWSTSTTYIMWIGNVKILKQKTKANDLMFPLITTIYQTYYKILGTVWCKEMWILAILYFESLSQGKVQQMVKGWLDVYKTSSYNLHVACMVVLHLCKISIVPQVTSWIRDKRLLEPYNSPNRITYICKGITETLDSTDIDIIRYYCGCYQH